MPLTRAYEVTSFGFAKDLGLSDAAIVEWRLDMSIYHKEGLSVGYTTNYRFDGTLWYLPGQVDHHRFSDDCREIYAGLVIEWLARAPKEVFKVDLRHEHFSGDHREWSTPVQAFLRSGVWLPAEDPSSGGPIRHFYRAADIWVAGAANDRFPFFLRQISVSINKVIDRLQPEALHRLRSYARLRVLNNPLTVVDQACFLAAQYFAGIVRPHYEPQLVNLYNSTWKMIADKHAADPQAIAKPANDMPILFRRGTNLAVAIPGKESAPLYVRDNEDDLAPSLVASIDGLLMDIKGADRVRVGAAVNALFGKKVSRLSALRYDVKIDGVALEDIEPEGTALVNCPWLRVMLAVAMEGLRGNDASQLPSDRSAVLGRLENVAILVALDVLFEINDQRILAPGDRAAYVFRRSGLPTLVVTRGGDVSTWKALQGWLPAVCEAIELPSVANGMRLLAHELEAAGEEVNELNLDDNTIARLGRTLHLEGASLVSVRHLIDEAVELKMPWIRAAIHYGSGNEALNEFDRLVGEFESDPARLLATLMPIITAASTDPDELLRASRQAQSAAQFREILELEFAGFNESLLATGGEPLTYPSVHAAQILNYIVELEITILEALRNASAPALDAFEPAPEYVQRRDELRSLKPDPVWLTLFHFVPEAALAERVSKWLKDLGASEIGANLYSLQELSDVRSANLEAVGRFASVATPIVRAW